MRRSVRVIILALAGTSLFLPVAVAQTELPNTLEECYLTVATTRSSPEAIQLAKQVCDAAFGRSARPLAFLDPKSKTCDEWWFDRFGRYESADRYCSLESNGASLWKLACQWKNDKQVTFVKLRESGARFERVGELQGRDVGEVFSSLAGCVEQMLEEKSP